MTLRRAHLGRTGWDYDWAVWSAALTSASLVAPTAVADGIDKLGRAVDTFLKQVAVDTTSETLSAEEFDQMMQTPAQAQLSLVNAIRRFLDTFGLRAPWSSTSSRPSRGAEPSRDEPTTDGSRAAASSAAYRRVAAAATARQGVAPIPWRAALTRPAAHAGTLEHPRNLCGLLGQHERHDPAGGTRTCGASGAVEVGLVLGWWVEVHDQVDTVHVDSAGSDVRRDQDRHGAGREGRQRALPGVLCEVAVQRTGSHAGTVQLAGKPCRAMPGPHEQQHPAGPARKPRGHR